jgi:hypothetical protein
MLAEGGGRKEQHNAQTTTRSTLSENGRHATGGSLASGSRVSVRLHQAFFVHVCDFL